MKSIKQFLSKLTKPLNNRFNAFLKKRIDKLDLDIYALHNELKIVVESIDSRVEDIGYNADEALSAVNDYDFDDMERGIRNNYNSICEIEETVSDNDAHIRELFSKSDDNNTNTNIEELRDLVNTLSNDLRHLQTIVQTNPEDAQKVCDMLNSNLIVFRNTIHEHVDKELKQWSVITATQLKPTNNA